MGNKNATPCLRGSIGLPITENNATPIEGHRLFKNLYKLVVPCPSFIRSDQVLNFGNLQIRILRISVQYRLHKIF